MQALFLGPVFVVGLKGFAVTRVFGASGDVLGPQNLLFLQPKTLNPKH